MSLKAQKSCIPHNIFDIQLILFQIVLNLSVFVSVCLAGDGHDRHVGQVSSMEGEKTVCGADHVHTRVLWGDCLYVLG